MLTFLGFLSIVVIGRATDGVWYPIDFVVMALCLIILLVWAIRRALLSSDHKRTDRPLRRARFGRWP